MLHSLAGGKKKNMKKTIMEEFEEIQVKLEDLKKQMKEIGWLKPEDLIIHESNNSPEEE